MFRSCGASEGKSFNLFQGWNCFCKEGLKCGKETGSSIQCVEASLIRINSIFTATLVLCFELTLSEASIVLVVPRSDGLKMHPSSTLVFLRKAVTVGC